MAALRKKWSTTTVPSARRRSHTSQADAYRRVQQLGAEYHAGMLRADLRHVQVWVDERDGYGWRLHDSVDLADAAWIDDKEQD